MEQRNKAKMAKNNLSSQLFIVVSAFMIHFVTHGIVYSFGVIFVALDSLFEGSKAEIAWIGSITTSMIFFGGPLTGYLTARFGCRWVAVGGAFIGFLGYGVSIFVSNLFVLYLTMGFIAGNGFGFLYLPAIVAVTQAFDKYRTVACGLSLCGAGIGAFVFSPLQQLLLDKYSWQGTLLIDAGIILNCVPFALLLQQKIHKKSREIHQEEKARKEKEDKYNDAGEDTEAGEAILTHQEPLAEEMYAEATTKSTNIDHLSMEIEIDPKHNSDEKILNNQKDIPDGDTYDSQRCVQYNYVTDGEYEVIIEPQMHEKKSDDVSFMDNFRILKEPLFVLFASSQFFFFFGLYLPFMYIPDRAITIGMDETNAVWAVSTIGISSIVSRVVLGYVVDWLSIDRVKFMTGTLLLGGISTALGPVVITLWALYLYAVVYGISIGVSISFITAALVDLLGMEKLNEAFGMNNMFTGIAVLLGPPFAGSLYDMSGNYDATFIAAGVSQVLAGVLMMFAPLLKKKRSRFSASSS